MIFSRNVSEALAAVFKGRGGRSRQVSGGHGEGETPLPIPNRAVKPLSADGTWPARARESRTPPVCLRRAAPVGGSSALGRPAGAAALRGSAHGTEADRGPVRDRARPARVRACAQRPPVRVVAVPTGVIVRARVVLER